MEKMQQIPSSQLGKKNRIEIYDWVRLIATMLVVVGHCAYFRIHTEYGGVSYELPEDVSSVYYHPILDGIRFLSGWVYGYHMPLFFVLSGAVLALSPIGRYDDFLKRKIKRLMIPYVVYGWLFMLPIKFISGFYTKNGFVWAMNGFLLGVDSGHLWFLTALFWCMAVFVLLVKLMRKLQVESDYLLIGITALISMAADHVTINFLSIKEGLDYLCWFAVGYVWEHERKKIKPWSKKQALILFLMACILTWMDRRYRILPDVYSVFLGIVRIYLLAVICMKQFPAFLNSPVGNIIKRNLFNIYLFHDPLEYVVLKLFLNGGGLSTGAGCVLFYFARIVLVIVVSIGIGEAIRMAVKYGHSKMMS